MIEQLCSTLRIDNLKMGKKSLFYFSLLVPDRLHVQLIRERRFQTSWSLIHVKLKLTADVQVVAQLHSEALRTQRGVDLYTEACIYRTNSSPGSINNNVCHDTKHTRFFFLVHLVCMPVVGLWFKVPRRSVDGHTHHFKSVAPAVFTISASKVQVHLCPLWSSFFFLIWFSVLVLAVQASIYKMSLWPRILRLISAKATENTKAFSSERLA